MITPATYTEDAVNQLNQQGIDVVNTTILHQQRNFARRHYAGEAPWGWANKPTTLTFDADETFTDLYSVSAPSGIDYRHPVALWTVSGGCVLDWQIVPFAQLFETTSEPRFWVDENAGTVYSNTSGDAYCLHQEELTDLPLNTSQDAVAEPFPNATAITWKLAEFYVLATRQEKGSAQYFADKYSDQLSLDLGLEAAKLGRLDLALPVARKR